MGKNFRDLPFVSSSCPVKITKDERMVGPNIHQAWIITDRINRDKNLREKWIIRHAARLGLEGEYDELIDKYGSAAQLTMKLEKEKAIQEKEKKRNKSRPMTARTTRAERVEQHTPAPPSRVRTSRASSIRSVTSGASSTVVRHENHELRRENEMLKARLGKLEQGQTQIPRLHADFRPGPKELDKLYPNTRGPWDKRPRPPMNYPAGETRDPCNMPRNSREVKAQKSASHKLASGGTSYIRPPPQNELDAMGRQLYANSDGNKAYRLPGRG